MNGLSKLLAIKTISAIIFFLATLLLARVANAELWEYGSGDACMGSVSGTTPDEAFDQLSAKVTACYPQTTWVKKGACVYRPDTNQTPYGGAADCYFDAMQSWGTMYNQDQPIGKICSRTDDPHYGDPSYPYYDSVSHDCACTAGLARGTDGFCHSIKYFVAVSPPSQCDSCDRNSVGDPLNPATGAVFNASVDISAVTGLLTFKRSYNGTYSGASDIGGWRHAYSRSLQIKNSTIETKAYLQSASTSSQYTDPATACVSGFAEIQSQVENWDGAVASYANQNCVLTKNDINIGVMTVYSTGAPIPTSTPIAYDAVRDDGKLIRFIVNGNSIIAPPGVDLELTKTNSGFLLTDANDTVESYDANGKLQSITNRNGVVQTLSYDSSGRLSSVTDNFGHSLSLSYDSDNHLLSVTRQ